MESLFIRIKAQLRSTDREVTFKTTIKKLRYEGLILCNQFETSYKLCDSVCKSLIA